MGDELRGTIRLAGSEMGARTVPEQAVRMESGGFLYEASFAALCCFLNAETWGLHWQSRPTMFETGLER